MTAAPTQCPTCGHWSAPVVECRCGHAEVLHDLARDNRTRKACSHSEGPEGTPCGCRRFTPKEAD